MRTALFFAAGLLALAASAHAHGYRIADIEIGHPWTRATPPAATVASGYLKLVNDGAAADRLVAASTPAAARVEIHEVAIVDGVARMRAVTDGVEIPAGGTVELAPGGYHLMLIDLRQPIAEGDRIPMTLEFESSGSVDVELAVEAALPASAGHGGGHEAHSTAHDHGGHAAGD
jgi:copper(I)-binding protein